jgi:hypothetical protein
MLRSLFSNKKKLTLIDINLKKTASVSLKYEKKIIWWIIVSIVEGQSAIEICNNWCNNNELDEIMNHEERHLLSKYRHF